MSKRGGRVLASDAHGVRGNSHFLGPSVRGSLPLGLSGPQWRIHEHSILLFIIVRPFFLMGGVLSLGGGGWTRAAYSISRNTT